MIRRLMKDFDISLEQANLIYYAYRNDLLDMIVNTFVDKDLKDCLRELETGEVGDRELYDKLVSSLEDYGLTNKKLYQFNGYPTIVYSKGLGKMLNQKVHAYGFDMIVDIIVKAYKHGMRNNSKMPTLNNFFKDENGTGINNFITEYIKEDE